MENNNNQTSRGRGRGRGGNRRNFGSDSVERAEANKLQAKKDQISEVKHQTPKVVDNEKKQSLIEKGKAWFSKHFEAMNKTNRGNVRVTLNRNIDFELYSLYESRLQNIVANSITYNDKALDGAKRMLKPLISTLIGIKLLKANTQFGKANLVKYRGISDIDIKAPGNLLNIIDNIGKSDAINDNIIRINYQNAVIKQKFFDAIVDFASNDHEYDHSNFQFTETGTLESLKEYAEKYLNTDKQLRLYDYSIDSVEMIHSMGKAAIKKLNRHEFKFKINEDNELSLRLPYLSPDHLSNIEEILIWAEKVKLIFSVFDADVGEFKTVMSLALVGWMPIRFIKQRNKTFSEIDSRFDETIFSNATAHEVLTLLDFYPMEIFMTDDNLVDNTINLLGIYKNRYEKIFDLAFHMKDFKPTEFGSSAIIVEGHQLAKRDLENYDMYGGKINVVANRAVTNSKLKMKDDEAMFGTIFKFNNGVTMDTNYDIVYSNTTHQIRLDYVNKDFKN